MAGARLPKAALTALHSVRKERRLKKFALEVKVDWRSVKNMADGKYVDISLVRKVEAGLAGSIAKDKPAIEVVETIVCTSYGITREALQTGTAPLVIEAKQVSCLLMKEESGKTAVAIAKHYGYSDHTGAIDAMKKIRTRMEVNADLRSVVKAIRTKIAAL